MDVVEPGFEVESEGALAKAGGIGCGGGREELLGTVLPTAAACKAGEGTT